jgi:hypothetical protein
MPEDIYERLWVQVKDVLSGGAVAVTTEIYEEMSHIPGSLGECIKANRANLRLEVGEGGWDSGAYARHVDDLSKRHRQWISECSGERKGTVGVKT